MTCTPMGFTWSGVRFATVTACWNGSCRRRTAGGSLLRNAGPDVFRSHALPQEFVPMQRTRHELDVTRHLHSGQYQGGMSVLTSALAF